MKRSKGKVIPGRWEARSVEDIRNENFTLPADEPLKDKKPVVSEPAEGEFMNIPDGFGEELPFD